MTLFYIILATLFISLISLLAVFLFFKFGLHRRLGNLISLSAGVLLAVAWLDTLPEAYKNGLSFENLGLTVLLTILILFLAEATFHWHSCQHGDCEAEKHKHLAWFNLFGDGLHNFVDGAVIAAAFLADVKLGLITTLAVLVHEIPQELSDASILNFSGLTKKRIYGFNFLFAILAMAGGVATYCFVLKFSIMAYLLAIAGANFIYLSLTDLMPLVHEGNERKKIVSQVIWFLIGVSVIYGLGVVAK
ncbi:MAG: ZIP family metal transporter [Patescibacteria group bacterium]|nr:ZIP family metal transporter [Patescibacteria group bacterium]